MQTADTGTPARGGSPEDARRRTARRGIAFSILAAASPAVVHLLAGAAAPWHAFAVLTTTVGTTMHARLALGRWPSLVQLAAGVSLVWLLGAPPRLVSTLAAAGLAGAMFVARAARRASVLIAGVLTGAATALLSLVWHAAAGSPGSTPLTDAAGALAAAFLGGAIVLVAGPMTEWLFGLPTRLTMSEWLSYDHPLLRQLSLRAPGTFQHSVNVGILADAAAGAIGADALVARTGGLYHDVGKLAAPEFFAENQHGTNPHDALEPAASAAILRAHVTGGVELVRAHRMGERIADFVREHHGTGVMRLIQDRARAADAGSPTPEMYRYPGPAPQSRETGIVMMADQIEATARAAPPADEEACSALVARTIGRIAGEGALAESGLRDDDLEAIAPALARVLAAMYHHRPAYPAEPTKPPPRTPRRRLLPVGRLLQRRGRARGRATPAS